MTTIFLRICNDVVTCVEPFRQYHCAYAISQIVRAYLFLLSPPTSHGKTCGSDLLEEEGTGGGGLTSQPYRHDLAPCQQCLSYSQFCLLAVHRKVGGGPGLYIRDPILDCPGFPPVQFDLSSTGLLHTSQFLLHCLFHQIGEPVPPCIVHLR